MKRICSRIARAAIVVGAALSLVALQTPAYAKKKAEAAETVEVTENPARPALWKIADEDTTIYLFGTVHILPKGVDWFNGRVATAFAESDALVTEIVDEDPAMMQSLLFEKAMLQPGGNLRHLLSDDQRKAYELALASLGMPPGTFDPFEIWYAAVGLSTLPILKEGYASDNGVEELLEVKAKERAMPHAGLETAEYQLSLFDNLPQDVQVHYLSEVVEQLPNIKEELGQMVEAWKFGEAEKLAELMNAGESDPALVEALLLTRNRAWAKWIDTRLDEPGTVFVAVGAGHLAGDGSLQEQLELDGIASERLQ